MLVSNTLPDLLSLLAPAEHEALMSVLRARIDGRTGTGRLAVLPDTVAAAAAAPPPLIEEATQTSDPVALFSVPSPSFAGVALAASPSPSASSAVSPSGPAVLGVPRERSKSISLRPGLQVRRPSLQSVCEEGAAGVGATAVAEAGGITAPQIAESSVEAQHVRSTTQAASTGTSASLQFVADASIATESVVSGGGAHHRRDGSSMGSGSLMISDERPRTGSLSMGQGGLLAVPSNWSRQGSSTSTSVSLGTEYGDDAAADSDNDGGGADDDNAVPEPTAATSIAQSLSAGPSAVPAPHMQPHSLARSVSAASLALDSSSHHHHPLHHPHHHLHHTTQHQQHHQQQQQQHHHQHTGTGSGQYPPAMSPPERAQSVMGVDVLAAAVAAAPAGSPSSVVNTGSSAASTSSTKPARRLVGYPSAGANALSSSTGSLPGNGGGGGGGGGAQGPTPLGSPHGLSSYSSASSTSSFVPSSSAVGPSGGFISSLSGRRGSGSSFYDPESEENGGQYCQ
jgi:hypothetical protein